MPLFHSAFRELGNVQVCSDCCGYEFAVSRSGSPRRWQLAAPTNSRARPLNSCGTEGQAWRAAGSHGERQPTPRRWRARPCSGWRRNPRIARRRFSRRSPGGRVPHTQGPQPSARSAICWGTWATTGRRWVLGRALSDKHCAEEARVPCAHHRPERDRRVAFLPRAADPEFQWPLNGQAEKKDPPPSRRAEMTASRPPCASSWKALAIAQRAVACRFTAAVRENKTPRDPRVFDYADRAVLEAASSSPPTRC